MFDLHAHILPGVDDGARTPEECIEMARAAAEAGTSVILATPHRKDVTEGWSVAYVRDLAAEMRGCIREEGIALDLVLGMENHLDLDLPREVAEGRALTINGTRYILVEMPFFGRPNYLEDVLFQLQVQGLTPVLAHPERIEAVQRDPGLLARLVERGMVSQVTAGSVQGHFGARVRRFTAHLLKAGLVHVLASDTHQPRGPRAPGLTGGVEAAAQLVGEVEAASFVREVPRAILEGKPVALHAARRVPRPSRRWGFW